MQDSFTIAEAAAEYIRQRTQLRPKIAVVLGSGLGPLADELRDEVSIPFEELPGFHKGGVAGHASKLVVGKLRGQELMAFSGRVHAYEGHDLQAVVHPVRTASRFGVETMILTNAAGSLDRAMAAGSLMLIRDHINLTGDNVLRGPNDERWGPRFPDMTDAWTAALADQARKIAEEEEISLFEGSYAGMLGPTYETPAEIKMLRTIGARAVGMSTVHEATAARHAGMKLLGISCITNMGAGLSQTELNHDDVQATAAAAHHTFKRLVTAILTRIKI